MKPLAADLALERPRWLDFVTLTKPRVAVLVLFTVVVGALLARNGPTDLGVLIHTLVGTALVAAGASALNQLLERHTDGLMRRTENRPLPAGRLQPTEVLVFGLSLGLLGLAYLACMTRQPLTIAIAGFTFVSYVVPYTLLKPKTTLNTLVGAVPGAMPPLIGWTAMAGTLDVTAVGLFLVLFLWQVPHFLAIAWLYREDYGRAGLKMLPVNDPNGNATARQMLAYGIALVALSLAPAFWPAGGWLRVLGTLVLGGGFLWAIGGFIRARTDTRARRVLQASLVYLPLFLGLLLLG